METIVLAISVFAFGIACGTLAYVHEFRHILRDFRGGMERPGKSLERHDKRMGRFRAHHTSTRKD